MEAGDSGARQSRHSPINSISTASASATVTLGTSPTNGTEQRQSHPAPYQAQREPLDRPPYREQPAMATATVLTPSAHYHAQPSYPSPYQPGPAASIPTMISSEPRKSADDEVPTRQSLPSISEVISGAKPGQYPPAPPHHTIQPGSGLPSPFAPISRSYPEADRHSSPQPLHPATSFPPRQDALPSFADSPRSAPFNGRPSLPPVSDRRPSPTTTELPQHRGHEPQRAPEPHPMNGAYPPQHPHVHAHPHAPPPHHPSMPFQGSSQLPPGQVPLPAYPISPRHAPPHLSGPHDPRGPPPGYPEEPEYASRARYDAVNRHFETWSYQENLSRIGTVTRTIFNFAEGWGKAAQEQHGSPPPIDRLPTEVEVGDMLSNVELVKHSLEQVREMVQISIQERAREGAKAKGAYDDDHDVAMYGGGMKPSYAMTEVKKRRGRAAPPGRCHSCNRIDTPEWRRGPDGARTLCNACGLHYAKLERKRQLEARSIRPKPEDRN